jgi:hypothetical protein
MEEKCLVCGGNLELDMTEDFELDGDTVYVHCVGWCEECGASHKWIEVYSFQEIRNAKLIQ